MPYSPESIRRAEELIRLHDGRALQILVDEIVAAVRSGNEFAVTDFDRVLQAVERVLPMHQLVAPLRGPDAS